MEAAVFSLRTPAYKCGCRRVSSAYNSKGKQHGLAAAGRRRLHGFAGACELHVRERPATLPEEEQEQKPRIPGAVPLVPLRDAVPFPGMAMPLVVGRAKSVKAVDQALLGDKIIALVAQKDAGVEEPSEADVHAVGVAGQVLKMFRFPDETTRILVQGLERVRIGKFIAGDPVIVAEVFVLDEKVDVEERGVRALFSTTQAGFLKLLSLLPQAPEEMKVMALNIGHPGRLADLVAANINVSTAERQQALETLDVKERLSIVNELLNREIQVAELGNRIQKQVQEKMEKGQREYVLREQLKAIRKELGEEEGKDIALEELGKKLAAAGLSEEARKEAGRELERLERMNPASPEYSVALTYLEWLASLPWQTLSTDNPDIERARRILEHDHYNLEKPKERILEYIAVRKLKPDNRGPILCFIGPPGVGKTSLGKSIAQALGRKFYRMSLGGIRDEAEIRGHRRTYVGALPGKIVQGIARAGSRNPVFMLDEVDKIGVDFRGDPASALLEVLDPEQNNTFVDHYLGVAFDLSQVMFIVTGNILDTIPPALRDRLEILTLPGYTDQEKVEIAKKFLLPRQLSEHGLPRGALRMRRDAMLALVRSYTRESGVRNLERAIAEICRKVAVKHAAGRKRAVLVSGDQLAGFLGPPKVHRDVAERLATSGVAIGLAWTPAGGEILFVEATRMPAGRGGFILTGQLGEVMQESGRIALSILRSHASDWAIKPAEFRNTDIHIHVPEGAIPKDGPSAGIVMVLALVSLFTGRPARSDTAATGEITLRGKLMPVSGIKEKVLAAKRAGISRVLMPAQNRPDVQEIPERYLRGLEIVYVSTVSQAIEHGLLPARKPAASHINRGSRR